MVMNLLFLTAFSCWLLAWIDTEKKADAMLPRKFWRQHDPTLIGEAIYSIAVVFAFGRLFYFFQVSQELGPLQVCPRLAEKFNFSAIQQAVNSVLSILVHLS